ncbi:hypothetical protein B0H17DRAFT_1065942, partial [Mycena rosella]
MASASIAICVSLRTASRDYRHASYYSPPRGKGAESTGPSTGERARTGAGVMVRVRSGGMWGRRAHASQAIQSGRERTPGNKETRKRRKRRTTIVDWSTVTDGVVSTLALLGGAMLGGALEGGGVGAPDPGSLALLGEPVSLVALGLVGALALVLPGSDDDGLRILDRLESPGRLIAVPKKSQDKVSKGRYRRGR